PDPKVLYNNLDDRSQRVRCTASHADDLVFRGIESVEVYPGEQYRIAVFLLLAGGTYEDALGTGVEMSLRPRTRGGTARAINNQVDSERLPIRQPLGRIEVRNPTATDAETIIFCVNLFGPAPVVRIDLKERC